MKRNFDELMHSLKKSITPADFFVDFPKIYVNAKDYLVDLNTLNSLIGEENIEKAFIDLISQRPEIMRSIPILLATHEHKFNIINAKTIDMTKSIQKKKYDFFDEKFICYDFEEINHPIEDYVEFLKTSGLLDILNNRKIKNLADYAIGVEAGLDSNSRKNRRGKIMEEIVEEFMKQSNIPYQTQINYKKIDEEYGTNLCSIGKSTKKFDFVFKSSRTNEIVVMEVNYYETSGSKPNETAKSYIELNEKIKNLKGVKFVWITDGLGWTKSRLNLEDAYDNIDDLYTIKDLEDGILNKL